MTLASIILTTVVAVGLVETTLQHYERLKRLHATAKSWWVRLALYPCIAAAVGIIVFSQRQVDARRSNLTPPSSTSTTSTASTSVQAQGTRSVSDSNHGSTAGVEPPQPASRKDEPSAPSGAPGASASPERTVETPGADDAPTTILQGSPALNAKEWQSTQGPFRGLVQAMVVLPGRLLAATKSDGVWALDTGGAWRHSSTGLVATDIASLYTDPLTGIVYAGTRGQGVFRSDDKGGSWTQSGLAGLYLTALHAFGSSIYAGDGHWCTGLYRRDELHDWATVAGPRCINTITTTKDGTLFVGTGTDGVFVFDRSTGSWQAINTGLPDRNVHALATDRHDVVWIGTHRAGLYHLAPGRQWVSANAPLTDVTAICIHNETLVIAGEGGPIAESEDAGGTWRAYDTGLPEETATILSIVSAGDIAYVGCGPLVYTRRLPSN